MKISWMSWIEDFFEEEPSFDSLLVVYIRKKRISLEINIQETVSQGGSRAKDRLPGIRRDNHKLQMFFTMQTLLLFQFSKMA